MLLNMYAILPPLFKARNIAAKVQRGKLVKPTYAIDLRSGDIGIYGWLPCRVLSGTQTDHIDSAWVFGIPPVLNSLRNNTATLIPG